LKLAAGRQKTNGCIVRPCRTLGNRLAPNSGLKRTFNPENPFVFKLFFTPGQGAGIRPHKTNPLVRANQPTSNGLAWSQFVPHSFFVDTSFVQARTHKQGWENTPAVLS